MKPEEACQSLFPGKADEFITPVGEAAVVLRYKQGERAGKKDKSCLIALAIMQQAASIGQGKDLPTTFNIEGTCLYCGNLISAMAKLTILKEGRLTDDLILEIDESLGGGFARLMKRNSR